MMNLVRATTLVAFGALAAGCGDGTGPGGDVRIVSSPALDAVVGTALTGDIVLQYRDAQGRARSNVELDIRCAGLASADAPCLALGAVVSGWPVSYSVANQYTTDVNGVLTLRGRFTTDAGKGSLRILDEANGFVTSIPFTARPGPAVEVRLAPRDTAVRVSRTVRLRGFSYDAWGNARTDVLTWSVTGSAAELASPALVRGLAYGRALVRASLGAMRDSQWVSVVPAGTLAASWQNGDSSGDDDIRIFETDGTGALPPIGHAWCVGRISWSPSGHRLVFDRSPPGGGCFQPRLYTITPSGTATLVRANAGSLQGESMASWSGDGAFIHFIGRTDHQNGEVWRVPAAGGLGERLGPTAGFFDEDWFPVESPDGLEVVFGSLRNDSLRLRVITAANGAVRDLGIRAMAASWSPDGSKLAFSQRVAITEAGDRFQYHVMNADGSGLVVLPDTLHHMSSAPSWSPDGQWIAVVHDRGSGRLALVQVVTGLTLPLGWTQGMGSVSWKPTP